MSPKTLFNLALGELEAAVSRIEGDCPCERLGPGCPRCTPYRQAIDRLKAERARLDAAIQEQVRDMRIKAPRRKARQAFAEELREEMRRDPHELLRAVMELRVSDYLIEMALRGWDAAASLAE